MTTESTKIRFTKMRDGRYVQPEAGIELIKGIDDSDGYDRIEWRIWTHHQGYPIGRALPSLNAAKARAREIIASGGAK